MHSSLSGRLARTARVHDDQRQLAAKRVRNAHSPGSTVAGTCSGAAGLNSERRPYRSTEGSFSGMARPGAIQPALPQDAPAATPRRSTTVTSTPRS
ncbi:hypothetical protein GCM10027612_79910 [Microbispora bryophytorum subsp. camponoti]